MIKGVVLSDQGCSWEQTPPPPGADTPRSRHPHPQSRKGPRREPELTPPGADTPPLDTVTAADGTHPTGIHSCLSVVIGDVVLSAVIQGVVLSVVIKGVVLSVVIEGVV